MIECGVLCQAVQSRWIGGLPMSTPASWLSAYVTTFSGPACSTRRSSAGSSVAMWMRAT